MSLLLETLRAADGVFDDLGPHLRRMIRSRLTLWGIRDEPQLRLALETMNPQPGTGLWKIRVLYNREIRHVECQPYEPRIGQTAGLVDGGDIDYSHKWAERSKLDKLTKIAQNAGADIALIVKNGLITDLSHANAAFFDGSVWWTPARPLLPGTRRERLLRTGRMKTADITPREITRFQLLSPINSMLDLGDVTVTVLTKWDQGTPAKIQT